MPDDLPFVVRPPDSPAAAMAASEAARHWGLPEPKHLRTSMNALFLAGEDVMLRVSLPTAAASEAVWLMEQLRRKGVRVPELVRGEPFVAGELAVFALERIDPIGDVDWVEVGEHVRRLHEWPAGQVRGRYPLPQCERFPWWNTAGVLAEVEDILDASARAGLIAAIEAHGAWRSRVTSRVVCHGDVHPGNVIQSADGPVLLDWDLACHAPAAWDHAMLMTWSALWGGNPLAYESFAAGYGQSLRDDALAESLAVMRNVTATLMRLKAGRTNPAAADEAQRRLHFWRGDPAAPAWSAQ